MNFLPIDVDEVHEDILECYIVTGRMNRDFGPWEKDNIVRTLTFNFIAGDITEYGDNGKALKSCVLALMGI